jgi:hypothetical protein
MLEIISPEGISLDLPDDIAIEMEFNNPLFAEDSIVGDYSLNFTLDATDANMKAFRFVNRIEVKERVGRSYEGYKIKYGNDFIVGSLVVVELPWKKFQVRFKSNIGTFKELTSNYSMNQTELPETVMSFSEPGTPSWNLQDARDISNRFLALLSASQPIGEHVVQPFLFIPLKNEKAFNDNNQNLYFDHLNYYYNPDNTPGFDSEYIFLPPIVSGIDPELPLTPFSWHNFTPCINFWYLLFKSITSTGYNISAPIFSRKDLKALFCVGNNVNLHYYTFDINVDGQTKEFRNIDGQLSLPVSPFSSFILDFIKLFCVYADIDERKKSVELIWKEDILKDRSYIDLTDITTEEKVIFQEGKRGYEFKYEFDSSDDVLNENTIEPEGAQKYIGEYATFLDLPIADRVPINTVAYVADRDIFYITYRENNVIDWKIGYQNFSKLRVNDGGKTITINSLNPCLNYRDPDTYLIRRNIPGIDRSWKLPWFGSPCRMESAYSPFFENEDVRLITPSLKLFFYRGMHRDSRANSFYPLGASDEYNYNRDVVGESSLKFHGERGIANVWWKTYTDWRNQAKPVELYQKLDATYIFNIKQLWKQMVKVKEVNYRVEKIQVVLYKYRIGVATVKAYTAY